MAEHVVGALHVMEVHGLAIAKTSSPTPRESVLVFLMRHDYQRVRAHGYSAAFSAKWDVCRRKVGADVIELGGEGCTFALTPGCTVNALAPCPRPAVHACISENRHSRAGGVSRRSNTFYCEAGSPYRVQILHGAAVSQLSLLLPWREHPNAKAVVVMTRWRREAVGIPALEVLCTPVGRHQRCDRNARHRHLCGVVCVCV